MASWRTPLEGVGVTGRSVTWVEAAFTWLGRLCACGTTQHGGQSSLVHTWLLPCACAMERTGCTIPSCVNTCKPRPAGVSAAPTPRVLSFALGGDVSPGASADRVRLFGNASSGAGVASAPGCAVELMRVGVLRRCVSLRTPCLSMGCFS